MWGSLRRAPLSDSYAAAVAIVLLALCPFIVLSPAVNIFQQPVMRDLGASRFGFELASALASAGYALGAVVSADLIQRASVRRLYLLCEAVFVLGSVLALVAPGIELFTAGRVLQGLATGMLLVVALPPLVTSHGVERLPTTAAVVSLGLFGMVTLGPIIGGVAAAGNRWRLVFAALAVLGVAALVLGLLGLEDSEPGGRSFDWTALPLAVAATALPFFGVSWLARGTTWTSPGFLVPTIAGLAALVLLIVVQYHRDDPLMPMRPIAHTLPVTGIAGAMVAGAAVTALVGLAELYLTKVGHETPLATGALVTSQVAGTVLAAWLFRRLLPTRWLPVLALAGLVSAAAGSATLLLLSPGSTHAVVPAAALLLGFGAGAGVTPALFMVGLSVPSSRLGPTFALVELLRSNAAFLLAPVLLQLAATHGGLPGGVRLGVLVCLAASVAAIAAVIGTYLLGGARLQEPDLPAWLERDAPAFDSPPLAAELRDTDASDGARRGQSAASGG
ncbi:MAG TPA: MFS transporter [Gaiellales bacterium]